MFSIYGLFFLFTAALFYLSDAEVLIKSRKSGLVFDENEKNVKAVEPDNSDGQKWTLECMENGHFIIMNAKDKLVMDVQSGCETGQNIIVYEKHSGDNQQFYINSDGTIGTTCDEDLILQINENGIVETVPRSNSSGHDVNFELVKV